MATGGATSGTPKFRLAGGVTIQQLIAACQPAIGKLLAERITDRENPANFKLTPEEQQQLAILSEVMDGYTGVDKDTIMKSLQYGNTLVGRFAPRFTGLHSNLEQALEVFQERYPAESYAYIDDDNGEEVTVKARAKIDPRSLGDLSRLVAVTYDATPAVAARSTAHAVPKAAEAMAASRVGEEDTTVRSTTSGTREAMAASGTDGLVARSGRRDSMPAVAAGGAVSPLSSLNGGPVNTRVPKSSGTPPRLSDSARALLLGSRRKAASADPESAARSDAAAEVATTGASASVTSSLAAGAASLNPEFRLAAGVELQELVDRCRPVIGKYLAKQALTPDEEQQLIILSDAVRNFPEDNPEKARILAEGQRGANLGGMLPFGHTSLRKVVQDFSRDNDDLYTGTPGKIPATLSDLVVRDDVSAVIMSTSDIDALVEACRPILERVVRDNEPSLMDATGPMGREDLKHKDLTPLEQRKVACLIKVLENTPGAEEIRRARGFGSAISARASTTLGEALDLFREDYPHAAVEAVPAEFRDKVTVRSIAEDHAVSREAERRVGELSTARSVASGAGEDMAASRTGERVVEGAFYSQAYEECLDRFAEIETSSTGTFFPHPAELVEFGRIEKRAGAIEGFGYAGYGGSREAHRARLHEFLSNNGEGKTYTPEDENVNITPETIVNRRLVINEHAHRLIEQAWSKQQAKSSHEVKADSEKITLPGGAEATARIRRGEVSELTISASKRREEEHKAVTISMPRIDATGQPIPDAFDIIEYQPVQAEKGIMYMPSKVSILADSLTTGVSQFSEACKNGLIKEMRAYETIVATQAEREREAPTMRRSLAAAARDASPGLMATAAHRLAAAGRDRTESVVSREDGRSVGGASFHTPSFEAADDRSVSSGPLHAPSMAAKGASTERVSPPISAASRPGEFFSNLPNFTYADIVDDAGPHSATDAEKGMVGKALRGIELDQDDILFTHSTLIIIRELTRTAPRLDRIKAIIAIMKDEYSGLEEEIDNIKLGGVKLEDLSLANIQTVADNVSKELASLEIQSKEPIREQGILRDERVVKIGSGFGTTTTEKIMGRIVDEVIHPHDRGARYIQALANYRAIAGKSINRGSTIGGVDLSRSEGITGADVDTILKAVRGAAARSASARRLPDAARGVSTPGLPVSASAVRPASSRTSFPLASPMASGRVPASVADSAVRPASSRTSLPFTAPADARGVPASVADSAVRPASPTTDGTTLRSRAGSMHLDIADAVADDPEGIAHSGRPSTSARAATPSGLLLPVAAPSRHPSTLSAISEATDYMSDDGRSTDSRSSGRATPVSPPPTSTLLSSVSRPSGGGGLSPLAAAAARLSSRSLMPTEEEVDERGSVVHSPTRGATSPSLTGLPSFSELPLPAPPPAPAPVSRRSSTSGTRRESEVEATAIAGDDASSTDSRSSGRSTPAADVHRVRSASPSPARSRGISRPDFGGRDKGRSAVLLDGGKARRGSAADLAATASLRTSALASTRRSSGVPGATPLTAAQLAAAAAATRVKQAAAEAARSGTRVTTASSAIASPQPQAHREPSAVPVSTPKARPESRRVPVAASGTSSAATLAASLKAAQVRGAALGAAQASAPRKKPGEEVRR